MDKINPTSEKTLTATDSIFGGINGIVVVIEGDVWGPFDDGASALTWVYYHSKDGIFTLKHLLDPSLVD